MQQKLFILMFEFWLWCKLRMFMYPMISTRNSVRFNIVQKLAYLGKMTWYLISHLTLSHNFGIPDFQHCEILSALFCSDLKEYLGRGDAKTYKGLLLNPSDFLILCMFDIMNVYYWTILHSAQKRFLLKVDVKRLADKSNPLEFGFNASIWRRFWVIGREISALMERTWSIL